VKSAIEFRRLQSLLSAGPVLLPVTVATHDLAAEYFNRCRSRGVAASDVDALICAAAHQHGASIFSADADFERYATVLPLDLYGH
jgi:hypothetical protein